MKELTDREIQWLEAFAKNYEFFASFLLYYKLKQCLSNNQYYWLHLHINQAEENGDNLLNAEEVTFLAEKSENYDELKKIYESYKNKGYLEKLKYTAFLKLKYNISGKLRESKIKEFSYINKVVKIPCPHCNFLCSPQISYCAKCGEPLPKLEKKNTEIRDSHIPDVNYFEKNIILALEKTIDKAIPLKDKFDPSSTCYIKEGEKITGLSLFNCVLNTFPHEILRIKSLKTLALRRNNIKEIPKEIGFLSNLELLDLRINKLKEIPKAIGLLYQLKILNLSSNNLMMVPDSIGDLVTLKSLNLSNNKLKFVPESFENLKCLENLKLKANYWINIPESIEKLKKRGLQILK